MPSRFSAIEPLHAGHRLEEFTCGRPVLDEWLIRRGLWNHEQGLTKTYVVHRRGRVVGFHSLAMASVERARVPGRIRRSGPAQIPVVLLARLAVDTRFQGGGLGAALLKDAIVRAVAAADEVAARALLAHAKDADARGFYEHFGFVPSPTDPLHMFSPTWVQRM